MFAQGNDYHSYASHLAAEHKRLGSLLRQVEQQHGQWPRADLVARLKDLRTELAVHFDEEESGGCLEEAAVHRPSLTAKMNTVLHEHPHLLVELDRLIETTETSANSTPPDEITRRLQQLAQRLHEHEASENRILHESFGIEMP